MTFELLPAAMADLQRRIPLIVAEATNQVAEDIHFTAADNTPVDTTKALSNWRVGVGGAPGGVIGPQVPGLGGATKQASLAATVAEGKTEMEGRRVGIPIHISNNAPYIEGLNNGSISQQPGAFVQLAELAGQRKIAATRLNLKAR